MPLKGELFLACRYLKPQRSLITLLTYISLLGPILGVSVLLVVTSVMNGMPKPFIEAIKEYNPHITLEQKTVIADADNLVDYIEDNYKVKASPATPLKVFLQKENSIQPFSAKGIYPLKDKSYQELRNLWGSVIKTNHSLGINEIALSAQTGLKHNLKVGDNILLHSPEKYKNMLKAQTNGNKRINLSAAKELTIAGFYVVKARKIDQELIIMHQDTANEMLDMHWGDALNIDIKLEDPDHPEPFLKSFENDEKLKGYTFTPWKEQSNGIYLRIVQEKVQMTFVLFLIMAATGIGIGACIFSLVIQKTRDIGILKATGANPMTIVLIFLSQGAFIGILGSLIGFGIGLTALEYRAKIAQFLGQWDEGLKRLESVPMYLDPSDIQLILWGSISICLLAATVPAIIAASINPVKALQSGQ
jgi:lipoprotein-releasing system permease protein